MFESKNQARRYSSSFFHLFIALSGGIILGALLHFLRIGLFDAIVLFLLLALGFIGMRSVHFSFLLFLFSLPLTNVGAMNGVIRIRLYYLFFSFLVCSLIYNMSKKETEIDSAKKVKTPLDVPLCFFLGIILISILQTVHVPANAPIISNNIMNYPWIKSITRVILLISCFAVFYVVAALLNTKEKIRKYLQWQCFFTLFFIAYALLSMFIFFTTDKILFMDGEEALFVNTDYIPRIKATEVEPLFFGFYILVTLPVLLSFLLRGFLIKQEQEYSWYFILGSAGVMIVGLFLTQARSVLMGFFCSLFVLFFLYKGERSWKEYCVVYIRLFTPLMKMLLLLFQKILSSVWVKRRLMLIFIVMLLGIAIYTSMHWSAIQIKGVEVIEGTIIAPVKGIFDKSTGKYWSTQTRIIAYNYALEAFRLHPWLGIGYENYNFYSGNVVYQEIMVINMNWPEVNNYPLKVLTELGIIGFFIFLLLVCSIFFSLYTAMKKTNDPFLKTVLKGYMAVLCGVGVVLLFSSNVTRPYLWVALGFAMAAVKIVKKEVVV